MMDTDAFREFKTGLTLLRDNYVDRALPHMKKAAELDRNNPYYMSYLGVVLAKSEKNGARRNHCVTPRSA
jgi:Flp pilus assembly protein TadD